MPTAWAEINLLAFLGALAAAWRWRADLRPVSRPALAALAALVLLAAALRGLLVPHTVFRGHYNAFHQVRIDLGLAEGRDTTGLVLPGGHGVPVAWLARLVGVGPGTYYGLNVAYGVAAVPAAFLALRAWLRGDERAALAGAGLLALDPVHARDAGSEDPMALAALCAWCAFLGLAAALRSGRARWLLLAAAAMALSVSVKTDSVLVAFGLAVAAWCDGLRGRWSPPRDRATLALAAGWFAASVAALAWRAAQHPEYVQHRQYLGMPALEYLAHAARLPAALVFHNPLIDPRYALVVTSALAVAGLVAGAARPGHRRQAAGWMAFVAVLFVRVYQETPLAFDDSLGMHGGVKGDVRWNLHASVPWLTLAALGFQWVRSRARAPWAEAALLALGCASLVPTRHYWRRLWTDQREALQVAAAGRALPTPCALVTPSLANPRDRRAPFVDPSLPLVLLDLEGPRWRAVPRLAESDLGPAGRDPRRSCAVFYRGLGCYVWPLDARPEASAGERPECRRLFGGGGLVPVRGLTFRARYEDYSAFHVVAPEVELGFYRAAGGGP